MPIDYRTCRFCRELVDDGDLVHYNTRHYAHPDCLFKAKGAEALLALPTWMLADRVPYRLLIQAGILDTFKAREAAQERA